MKSKCERLGHLWRKSVNVNALQCCECETVTHLPTFWLEDVEAVRFDVEPNMAWVKLIDGKQYRLTRSEHAKLIDTGKAFL